MKNAAIPASPRKTLLEWIEFNDGDPISFILPARSDRVAALHARIAFEPGGRNEDVAQRSPAPAGLPLPPLG